jgi:hypothetical protein
MKPVVLFVFGLAVLGTPVFGSPPEVPDGATVDNPVARLKVGMTEAQVRALMKPVAVDSGVEPGIRSEKRIYFEVPGNKQIYVEIGPGRREKVVEVGPLEAKGHWNRLTDGGIFTDDWAARWVAEYGW